MKVFWAFPDKRWNQDPVPEPGDLDPNRAFLPLHLARRELQRRGHEVLPLNDLFKSPTDRSGSVLCSFDGMQQLPRNIRTTHRIEKIVHFFMEAPMVGMRYYAPRFQQRVFELADRVFVQHPSYLWPGFRKSPQLSEFRYAHSHLGVDETLFETKERRLLVAINANKGISVKQAVKRLLQGINPFSYQANWLLNERNRWLHDLARQNGIDVFGHGWNRLALELSHFSYPLENKAWQGSISGPKFEVLSRYDFCLCYENSSFPGYITEKIFDCFSTGTIPVYRGAPDIDAFVPRDLFVDRNEFKSPGKLLAHLNGISSREKTEYRQRQKTYLADSENDPFSPLALSGLIVRTLTE